jgi:hypothetical protein
MQIEWMGRALSLADQEEPKSVDGPESGHKLKLYSFAQPRVCGIVSCDGAST